ncbi:hypothetical protein RHGRI_027952 [Rhododendron griersonianum]|uniref:RRM domain-containing protein n=1 Tax=Rhododendron griersonianum TaxID=479676 RepID=A0AAV6J306_9ERIC|nr:hypothetical protein RHGRI_027952 [Rhododendron griersonianum]
MAVVENAGINGAPSNRTDSHAPTDADQSKSNHSNGNPISRSNDQSFHVIVHQQPPMTTTAQANGTVNHNGGYVVQDNHQMVRNGVDEEREMRDLEEMLSKLNPMAEEFVPPSLASHRLVPLSPSHFGYTNGFDSFVIQNNPGIANGNIARRKKGTYSNGKKRMNSRTNLAQQEEVIRRTVYVSDIDHQVTEEQLAALFVHCGQVVDCRVCGDPNSVLRFAFIEFTDEEGARNALSLAGTMLGYYPVRVLPSKTAIAPVNPTFLPRSEDEREMCARTIYCTNIDKKVTQADVKLFFESICGEVQRLRLLGDYHHSTRIAFVEFVMGRGEVQFEPQVLFVVLLTVRNLRAESAIAALNCSGVVLGSLPIRVSPSKTPVRPRAPRSPMH